MTSAKKYHDAVRGFKRDLIARTLAEHNGNRTHAARTLGLQRTYLLRLIRDLGISSPRAKADPPGCTNGARSAPHVLTSSSSNPACPLPLTDPRVIRPTRISLIIQPRAV
jgi:hypothetical protein